MAKYDYRDILEEVQRMRERNVQEGKPVPPREPESVPSASAHPKQERRENYFMGTAKAAPGGAPAANAAPAYNSPPPPSPREQYPDYSQEAEPYREAPPRQYPPQREHYQSPPPDYPPRYREEPPLPPRPDYREPPREQYHFGGDYPDYRERPYREEPPSRYPRQHQPPQYQPQYQPPPYPEEPYDYPPPRRQDPYERYPAPPDYYQRPDYPPQRRYAPEPRYQRPEYPPRYEDYPDPRERDPRIDPRLQRDSRGSRDPRLEREPYYDQPPQRAPYPEPYPPQEEHYRQEGYPPPAQYAPPVQDDVSNAMNRAEQFYQNKRRSRGVAPLLHENMVNPPLAPRTMKPSISELQQNFGEGVGLGKGMDALPSVTPRRNVPVMGEVSYEQQEQLFTDPNEFGRAIGQAFGQVFSQNQPGPTPENGGFTFSFSKMTGEFTRPEQFDTLTRDVLGGAQLAAPSAAQATFSPPSAPAQQMSEFQRTVMAPAVEPERVAPEPELMEPAEAVRMPVGRVPLNPEDTGDDIDYDHEGGVIDASSGEEERHAVLGDIRRVYTGLKIRFSVTLVAFLALVYLCMSVYNENLPLPVFMFPVEGTAATFMLIVTLLQAGLMLLNAQTVGGGLQSLFTLKADADSLLALALTASVAQSVALTITPTALYAEGVQLYIVVPILGMLFQLVGRMMLMQRIVKNSRIAFSDGEKYVLRTIQSEDFSRELARGLKNNLSEVTYSVKTRFAASFLHSSYAPDFSEGIHRVLAVIVLLAAVLVSVASFFVNGSIYLSLTVFSALTAICAPFTAAIVGNLPMLRAAKALIRSGAAITGYPVVEEYAGVKAVTLKAKELFPGESITLVGMRVYQESLIEQAISDACSVICATDSPLAPLFKGMVASESLLKPAENILFEDSMGLSAWVDGKRVLIGNRNLMKNHGVSMQDAEAENRYVAGQDTIYLSNSGELIALFTLAYKADEQVLRQMKELEESGVSLIVHSTDPNITPERIATLFSYPSGMVKMVPASLYADFEKITTPRSRVRATILYTGSIMSMFKALGMIPKIKASVTVAAIFQLVAMMIGYAVVAFFAFFAGMDRIPFELLLLYQMVCAVVTIVISNLKKF